MVGESTPPEADREAGWCPASEGSASTWEECTASARHGGQTLSTGHAQAKERKTSLDPPPPPAISDTIK